MALYPFEVLSKLGLFGLCFCEFQPKISYRVSGKTVNTFVFRISRLPRGLEIPSWTFFNSPFSVDSKNIHFVIIW